MLDKNVTLGSTRDSIADPSLINIHYNLIALVGISLRAKYKNKIGFSDISHIAHLSEVLPNDCFRKGLYKKHEN